MFVFNVFYCRLVAITDGISFKSGLYFRVSNSGCRSHWFQHDDLLRHLWDAWLHSSSVRYIVIRRLGGSEGLTQIGLNMKQELTINDETIFVLIVVTAARELPRKIEMRRAGIEPFGKFFYILVEISTEYCKLCMEKIILKTFSTSCCHLPIIWANFNPFSETLDSTG